MYLKKNDLNLMIKMENAIGMNEKRIFGRNKNKTIDMDGYIVSYDDFIDYMNLIERLLHQ